MKVALAIFASSVATAWAMPTVNSQGGGSQAVHDLIDNILATTSDDSYTESLDKTQQQDETNRKLIWAEELMTQEYEDCKAKLPGNDCVRELFHLQGSVEEFDRNCNTKPGDLYHGMDHPILKEHYPIEMFPRGPQCGKKKDFGVMITKADYEPVCKICFPSKETASKSYGQ